jgi:predicted secreted Zn-dependent protease
MPVDFKDTEWVVEPVTGADLPSVAANIAGMDEAAKTEWWPSYSYETAGDLISSATVTLATKVTMPQWDAYDQASTPEQDEWRRFCTALRAHEQGHLDIVTAILSRLEEQLIGKTTDDGAKTWNETLRSIDLAESNYDSTTDHGRQQGTIIDVSVASAQNSD